MNAIELSGFSQWKRVVIAAAVTACNGLGGVAGSYIVRQTEASQYFTAVWVSIGWEIKQMIYAIDYLLILGLIFSSLAWY